MGAHDLCGVHARADDAHAHLRASLHAHRFVRAHKRRLVRRHEVKVVGDEVVGHKQLQRPRIREEAHLRRAPCRLQDSTPLGAILPYASVHWLRSSHAQILSTLPGPPYKQANSNSTLW